jgi:zinc transport system substrate-binding protein
MRRILLLAWVMVLAILWVGGGAWAQEKRIQITASILPLADFSRRIGAELVDVQVLVPPGASPHTFEPPPSVVARAAKARLLVYIGQGLEPWAERLARSLEKGAVAVEAAQGLPLIREIHQETSQRGHEHGEKGARSHAHGGANPHIWLDPVLVQEISKKIAKALIQIDPSHRGLYERNLEGFLLQLQTLDQEIRERVSGFQIRKYVCFHPAYVYFSRRYGLEEVGVIELSPGREPSPRHLRDLVARIREHGIRVVFAEPQLNPRVAEVMAKEAGVRVAMLDPLGGQPPYGSDYLALMRHNLQVMAEAMGER